MNAASSRLIYRLIDELAPFETQESYDNSGFLIGDMDAPVERVLVALDATPQVIEEALSRKAQLLITHHPVMFHAIKSIRSDVYEGWLLGRLLQSGLSLLSAHTNLDLSPLSGGAVIARDLGLGNIRRGRDPVLTLGDLYAPCSAEELGRRIGEQIGLRLRCYGDPGIRVSTLALAGGAYDVGYESAMSEGAQALLTGEVRYHNAIAASGSGFVIFDGGHSATEAPMMRELAFYLQNKLNELQLFVEVYASECHHHSEGYTL